MCFRNQAILSPCSNWGPRKKIAWFRPEKRFPQSAAWEGCEALVSISHGLFSTYGFCENKHDPARVRTRDLGEPKPKPNALLAGSNPRPQRWKLRPKQLGYVNCFCRHGLQFLDHSGLPLRAKTAHHRTSVRLLALGLVGARWNPFWVYFGLKSARVRRFQKMAVFSYGRRADFSPNLDLRRPKCRENSERPRLGPLSGHFWGVNFGTPIKKFGPLLGPSRGKICHMPIFLRKTIFSARLVFWSSRTAKKAAKRTRAGFRTCGSVLAALLPPSTPGLCRRLGGPGKRGCTGALRCTQPTDPPWVMFYAKGYCQDPSDHRHSDSPYSAAFTQH